MSEQVKTSVIRLLTRAYTGRLLIPTERELADALAFVESVGGPPVPPEYLDAFTKVSYEKGSYPPAQAAAVPHQDKEPRGQNPRAGGEKREVFGTRPGR